MTVATLTGENGLLSKVTTARQRNQEAEEDEKDRLSSYENKLNNYGTWERTGGTGNTVTISQEEYDMLKNTNLYSFDEVVVGKWVDTTPIYKKTFYIESLVKKDDGTGRIELSVANVKRVIDYKFNSNTKNNSKACYVNHSIFPNWLSGSFDLSGISIVDDKNIKIEYYSGYYDLQDAYLTIFYTKTTDTAPQQQ